jgi:hypothetical protein
MLARLTLALAALAVLGLAAVMIAIHLPALWAPPSPPGPVVPVLPKADDDALARFLAAYEPAAKELPRRYGQNRRIKLTSTRFTAAGEVRAKEEVEIVCGDSATLTKVLPLVRAAGGGRGRGGAGDAAGAAGPGVEVKNPRPSWLLSRPDNSFNITPERPGSGYDGRIVGAAAARVWLPHALTYRGEFLTDYIQRSAAVAVVELAPCEWQGRQLTRLRFQELAGRPLERSTVNVYFDPADHWLHHGLEVRTDGHEETEVTRYHYGPPRDGVTPPVKVERFEERAGQPPRLVSLVEYTEFVTFKPDPADFKLDRFDLVEP